MNHQYQGGGGGGGNGYQDDGYSSYNAGGGGAGGYDYYGQQQQQQQYSQEEAYNSMYQGSMDPYSYQHHQQQQQQQQQQPQYMDPSQQAYQQYPSQQGWDMTGAMSVDPHQGMMMMMHPGDMQQQQHGWQTTSGSVGTNSATAKKGDYYFDTEFTADELLYGHAVNAVAYDPTYGCMYLTGTTQNVSSIRYKVHRASLFMTYTTKSPNPSNPSSFINDSILYSSVAGHPEATSTILQAVYTSVYGIPKVTNVTPSIGQFAGGRGSAGGRRNHPPPHAYLPPYGGGELAESATPYNTNSPYGGSPTDFQQRGHVGIIDLLPLGDGYVASISPSAVRIHSYGGLQIHDHNVEGMLCGTIHPHSTGGPSHISVGGLSASAIASTTTDSSSSSTTSSQSTTTKSANHRKDLSTIHCLDLWQGLRVVYSRSFKDAVAGTDNVAVTAMATSHERGSIVAGCNDGKIRVLDGSLRELATVKSHLGGVSSISVSPDGMLIATTGYSSKAKPTSAGGSSNALYTFPDPTVYVYDIRYLGRGGISHPFAGVKGAPRFVRFVPDVTGCASNRLLVASGKQGGGIQILTPFEPQDEKTTSFFLPPLQQGESLTALSHPEENGNELALGTSSGRVLRYILSGRNTKQKQAKQQLEIPPYLPPLPDLSLDPTVLQGDPNMRNGTTEEVRSIFGTYTLLVSVAVRIHSILSLKFLIQIFLYIVCA